MRFMIRTSVWFFGVVVFGSLAPAFADHPTVTLVVSGKNSGGDAFKATITYEYNWSLSSAMTPGLFDYTGSAYVHSFWYSLKGGSKRYSAAADKFSFTTSGTGKTVYDLTAYVSPTSSTVEITIPVISGTFPQDKPPQKTYFPTTGGTFKVTGKDPYAGGVIDTIVATQTTIVLGDDGGDDSDPGTVTPNAAPALVVPVAPAVVPPRATVPTYVVPQPRRGLLGRIFRRRRNGR